MTFNPVASILTFIGVLEDGSDFKIDMDSEVLRSFAFYSSILIFKMFCLSFLTAFYRIKHKAFVNPEDLKGKAAKTVTDNPHVERARRAHMNDMENIFPFLIIGYLYCFTSPEACCASWLFRVFTAARIVHTLVYTVVVVRQPARCLSWMAGMLINVFMTVKVFMHFM